MISLQTNSRLFPCTVFSFPPIPPKVRQILNNEKDVVSSSGPALRQQSIVKNGPDSGLVCDKLFILICMQRILNGLSLLVPLQFLPAMMKSMKMPEDAITTIMTSVGSTNLIGRITIGFLAEFPFIGNDSPLTASMFLLAIIAMLFSQLSSFWLIMPMAAMYGQLSSIYFVFPNVQVTDYF